MQVGLFRLLLLPCELVVPRYRFHPVERSCSLVITTGCRAGQSETRERVVKKGKARSTQCRHAKPYYPGPTFGMARLDESEKERKVRRWPYGRRACICLLRLQVLCCAAALRRTEPVWPPDSGVRCLGNNAGGTGAVGGCGAPEMSRSSCRAHVATPLRSVALQLSLPVAWWPGGVRWAVGVRAGRAAAEIDRSRLLSSSPNRGQEGW